MLEKLKANILFEVLLKRHNIQKAYAMVGPEDSWYDTITTVHQSLAEIKQLPHEDWQITSHDGLELKALYYPGSSDKTVIWIHGYTSHAERESAFPGLFYHSLGFNVLVPYLRAHGPSQGKYISFGPMERLDMKKWVEQVNGRHPKGRILFHGLSMGGGIALDLATMDLENVKGLVVDAPSPSIPGFFQAVTNGTFKKGREKILACVYDRYRKEFSAEAADYDRTENIKNGKYPLFLTAGSNENMDEILTAIKERNPRESTVLILPGCNHGNGMYKQTKLYQDGLRAFIGAHIGD
ncbi:MAG: alpha/beta hydrolase [Oscillospiraceae bacterium]|nr:alpha/beta hydrolase [Oscillospiraceae bacterium]